MLIKNIKVGDRVEIQQKEDNDRSKTHVSQVESILDEHRVILHVPISYGHLVELTQGTEYRFLFFTEKGLVKFDGVVEQHMQEDGFAVMVVTLADTGDKIQRRDFFRFSCVLPLKYSIIEADNVESIEEIGSKKESFQGICKDIGGGGICFLANESIDEGATLKCVIKLDTEILVVICEVLQKHYFPKSNYRYQYRAGFIGILAVEQEKIVQFIFNEQKRMLQRLNR